MRNVVLNLPTFGFAVATRAALAAGIGLLIAERIEPRQRRRIGVGLIALGAVTTVPVVRAIARGMKRRVVTGSRGSSDHESSGSGAEEGR